MRKNIEELIKQNSGLIYKIASKYSKYYPVEDLYQVGAIGIIKAYKNYKQNSDAKFTTYAHKYIFGEINEFIRNDRTMKVSSDILKIYKTYEKAKDFLTNKYNKIPTISEIGNFMGIEEQILVNAIQKSEFALSLDTVLGSEDYTLESVLGNDTRSEIDNLIDLKNELEKLSEQERRLIELRYYKDYTQSETAEYLGMSQVQVSRSEKLILKKMGKNISVTV